MYLRLRLRALLFIAAAHYLRVIAFNLAIYLAEINYIMINLINYSLIIDFNK